MQPRASSWVESAVGSARSRLGQRFATPVPCGRCAQLAPRGHAFCRNCKDSARQAIGYFTGQATQLLWTVGPLSVQWSQAMQQFENGTGINISYALQEMQLPTAEYLRRMASFLAQDGVTAEEIDQFIAAATQTAAPREIVDPLLTELRRQQAFTSAREGNLPTLPVHDLHLSLGEICRFDNGATMVRQLVRGPDYIQGRLLLTNQKLRFLAPKNGFELSWSRILRVSHAFPAAFTLEVSGRSSPAPIFIDDVEWALAVIDALIQLDRRVILSGGRDTRTIPQHVKSAVWQRDQGRCVQCGADSYLEFDHVIPRARGGATSEGNLQLLCRGCNNEKGARI